MSMSPPLPGLLRTKRPELPEAPERADLPLESSNPYHNALQQLDLAARHLELDPGMHEILKYPQRELTVHFPVKMEDCQHPRLHRLPRSAQCGPRTL